MSIRNAARVGSSDSKPFRVGGAARLIASLTQPASRVTARLDGGGDQLVLVEFARELAVAVARLALAVGGVYLRRGLGRLPQ